VRGHAKQIKQAANLISKAEKPLLYVGGGVIASGASKELKELAELMQIPVSTTMMGKGSSLRTIIFGLACLGCMGRNTPTTRCPTRIS